MKSIFQGVRDAAWSVGLAALATTVGAQAADERTGSAQLRAAQARAAALRAETGVVSATEDHKAPTLRAFNAGDRLNVRQIGGLLPVDIRLTDNLTGVAYVYVEAHGPSGQTQSIEQALSFPLRDAVFALGMGLSSLSEPGVWQITYLYAYDDNGNDLSVGQAELARLGNVRFAVLNPTYDVAPPVLTSGRILTPVVSLSAPPKGVSDPSRRRSVGVVINATDPGRSASAGISGASMFLCSADSLACFSVQASNASGRPDSTAVNFVMGGLPGPFMPPGTYTIDALNLFDRSGNATYYSRTDTDFSKYFPAVTVELVP